MKKIIATLILAAASLSAHADGWTATTPNTDGGLIMLSNKACPAAAGIRGSIAKSYAPAMDDAFGCYTFDPDTDTVSVVWFDKRDRRTYRTYVGKEFTRTPYGSQQAAR